MLLLVAVPTMGRLLPAGGDGASSRLAVAVAMALIPVVPTFAIEPAAVANTDATASLRLSGRSAVGDRRARRRRLRARDEPVKRLHTGIPP